MALKIGKVEAPEDEDLKRRNAEIATPLPRIQQHLMIVAPTGGGKSNLVAWLLTKDGFLRGVYDRIEVFNPNHREDLLGRVAALPEDQIHDVYTDEALGAIMERQQEARAKGRPEQCLILFDDCQDAFMTSGVLQRFASKARHYDCTMWIVCQYCCSIPPVCRNQMGAFILMGSLKNRDLSVLEMIAPDDQLRRHYQAVRAQADPFAFLYITMKGEGGKKYWLNFERPLDRGEHGGHSGSGGSPRGGELPEEAEGRTGARR